ncbi:hypothetical protein ABIB68_002141 [Bradyrhizobium sp. F1.2.2]
MFVVAHLAIVLCRCMNILRVMMQAISILANLFHCSVDLSVFLIDLGVGVPLISGCCPADSACGCGPLCVGGWRPRGASSTGSVGAGACHDARPVTTCRSLVESRLGVGVPLAMPVLESVVPLVGLVFAFGAAAGGLAVAPEFAVPAAPAPGDVAPETPVPAEDAAPPALPPADPPAPPPLPPPPPPPPPWANAGYEPARSFDRRPAQEPRATPPVSSARTHVGNRNESRLQVLP